MIDTSVERYEDFSYGHIMWDCDTRYHAWGGGGGGKRETHCTCHMLFHNYLVILNSTCVRESLEAPITEIIYFQTYWKTDEHVKDKSIFR